MPIPNGQLLFAYKKVVPQIWLWLSSTKAVYIYNNSVP